MRHPRDMYLCALILPLLSFVSGVCGCISCDVQIDFNTGNSLGIDTIIEDIVIANNAMLGNVSQEALFTSGTAAITLLASVQKITVVLRQATGLCITHVEIEARYTTRQEIIFLNEFDSEIASGVNQTHGISNNWTIVKTDPDFCLCGARKVVFRFQNATPDADIQLRNAQIDACAKVSAVHVECEFSDSAYYHTAQYSRNDFVVTSSEAPAENPSNVLYNSGSVVTHTGRTKYKLRLQETKKLMLIKQLCLVTSAKSIAFTFYSSNGKNSTKVRRPRLMPVLLVCVREYFLDQLLVNRITLSFNAEAQFTIRDLIIQACSAPNVACGYSKFGDAGVEGGHVPQPSIEGGWVARTHEFPWQVLLGLVVSQDEWHYCGGVIIDRRYVLTTAHCLVNATAVIVYVGFDSLRNANKNSRRYIAQDFVIHKYYDFARKYNDVGLIRLRDPGIVRWSESAFPICLPAQPLWSREGLHATASGWGAMFFGGKFPVQQLRYTTNLTVLSFEECDKCINDYNDWLFDTLHNTTNDIDIFYDGMMCAGICGKNNRSTCRGDSGGALAWKNGELWEVLGLTSWGFGCASETPFVYSDVHFYKKWIQENTPDGHLELFPN